MKLTALAVVTLALGIVLGLALRDAVFEAKAKPPEHRTEVEALFEVEFKDDSTS